ncbi:polyphenol oxidase family protein [Haematomicrobium sanguinis]|uniref:polyphenol oxidase family protein n=1 Tax=Haematomicrobium sanguinis TaxID=479106 RepID=UPI00047C6B3C|nr:polyphenol oxidase family protein [Haematomicrobium sanguinis]
MILINAVGGAKVAFTGTAHGNLALHTGDDPHAVRRRRASLAAELGTADIAFVSQVHSARVVTAAEANEGIEADAILADKDGTALGILTADCLPVAFVLPASNGQPARTAVAHAGRRGLLDGVLVNTVAELRATRPDTDATQVHAWIGPAICAACYEVPEAMQQESERILPSIAATTRWGTTSLDLPGAAARQLERLGVAVHMDAHVCTLEDERYYSYRRNKTGGRMASVVWVP